jgi:hypothetical protein
MTATEARPQPTVERHARPTLIHPRRPDAVDGSDASPTPEANATLVEHELRRFPLSVVARWAVTLALTTMVAWWAAVGALWLAASALGLTGDIESLARDAGFEGFRLASGPVFLAVALLGAAWAVAVALIALFAAAVYNVYAALLGGMRVETIERVVPESSTSSTASTSEPVPVLID